MKMYVISRLVAMGVAYAVVVVMVGLHFNVIEYALIGGTALFLSVWRYGSQLYYGLKEEEGSDDSGRDSQCESNERR